MCSLHRAAKSFESHALLHVVIDAPLKVINTAVRLARFNISKHECLDVSKKWNLLNRKR